MTPQPQATNESLTLRSQIIEAMAKAIYEAQFPGFDFNVVKDLSATGQYFDLAQAALDAALDVLEANASQPDYEAAWEILKLSRPQWTQFVGDPFVVRSMVDAALAGRIAVLRSGLNDKETT